MNEQSPAVVALVRDLLFASKISAARAGGAGAVKIIHDAARLRDVPGSLLLVDLNQDGFLNAAIAWRERTGGQVIGFVAHVNLATIDAARTGGIDRVLSNGAFAAQLPALLKAEPDRPKSD